MANRNWPSSKIFSQHVMPILIDCQFTVSSTDSAGYGITSLKGGGVANVYMKTSATKAAGGPGGTTGPAAGVIVVQLQDNYNGYLSSWASAISPNGTPVLIDLSDALLTIGAPYVITTVGDATAAQWHTLGVPAGVTPAVGVAFIATAVGIGTSGTSAVAPQAANGSEILTIEQIGQPNMSIAPNPSSNQGFGAQLIFQCRNDSSGDHSAAVAPANGSVISLAMLLSNSSIQIAGE